MTDRLSPAEILRFYAEAGVDCALGDEAPNRFAEAAQGEAPSRAALPASQPAESAPLSQPFGAPPSAMRRDPAPLRATAAPTAPEVAVRQARELAANASTLEELREAMRGFDGCALKTTAMQLVFADGNPAAKLMLVGEGPGAEEDREGLPFVGRSGKLLDRMLAAIGIDRTSAYIANIIPWRPPGNRTPTPQESAICLPFVRRQIELADPDVLVCLGGPSASTLLEVKEGITKTRGRWFAFHTGKREIRAMATFHPAYLLRSPAHKKVAWRDLLAIRKALGS